MSLVRIKIGICEYYFEYKTLEEIKKHFTHNNMPYIGLDTLDNYGGSSKGIRIPVNDLTLEHVEWARESCEWGDRYLRGWKSR